MRFGMGTLSRLALVAGVMIVSACSDDPVSPPSNDNPAPSGLSASSTGTDGIALSWSAVSTSVTQFILQRAEGTGAFSELSRPGASSTSFQDTGLTPDTEYRYRLAAVRNGATSAWSTVASATTEATSGSSVVEVVTDITTSTTWTSDKTYLIKGFRKVANGATLTIQPGTIVMGDFDIVGSSLFVLRGGAINAIGTADEPIVFTSARPVGERQAGDWGGLILIGNGIINKTGTVNIEGTGTSADNPLVAYSGGVNNFDSSGRLSYVRVEYAGFGPVPDAELNSFTFAAVGSGTVMDHLQAHNGLDDSYEFFGGAADLRYAVSTEAGDDHFDVSEGYQGRIQFFVAFQSKAITPRAGAGNVSTDPRAIENDGCDGNGCADGQNSAPFTDPVMANGTLVFPGPGVVATGGGDGIVVRRGSGGHYLNTVVANFPSDGISYRDATSKARETAGLLSFKGIYIADTPNRMDPSNNSWDGPADDIIHEPATTTATIFQGWTAHPTSMADIDLRPSGSAPFATGGFTDWASIPDLNGRGAGLEKTSYRGAFAPGGPNWMAGWTAYSDN